MIDKVTLYSFRSVSFLGSINPSPQDLDKIAILIQEFDHDFKVYGGIVGGENLYLLYNRTISFLGANAMKSARSIAHLCAFAQSLGFMTSVRLFIPEVTSDLPDISLFQNSKANSLIFDISATPSPAIIKIISNIIDDTISCGKGVTLIGPVESWLESGALDLMSLNGANFRIMPSVIRQSSRAVHSSVNPCFLRFQLFVDDNGDVYPCQGLMGIRSYSLGRLNMVFHFLKNHGVSSVLSRWAQKGPCLSEPISIVADQLPAICGFHRSMLLGDGGTSWVSKKGRTTGR